MPWRSRNERSTRNPFIETWMSAGVWRGPGRSVVVRRS